jgi:uncharacterized membrane protein
VTTDPPVTGPSKRPVDPRAAQRSKLRRAVLQLVLGVVVVHSLALAIHYFGGVEQAPPRTRTIFVGVWTFATAITVAVLLRRVRLIRNASRGR